MSASQLPQANEPIFEPVCAIFRRFLKRQGLKFTPERAKTLDVVLGQEGVFEADALMTQMRQVGHRVGKATVYRTLKHLCQAHIINQVLIDSKQSHYQLSFDKQPTSHLVCLETSQITALATPMLQPLMDQICQEHGYTPLYCRFVIYGISPQAQKAQQVEDHKTRQP